MREANNFSGGYEGFVWDDSKSLISEVNQVSVPRQSKLPEASLEKPRTEQW